MSVFVCICGCVCVRVCVYLYQIEATRHICREPLGHVIALTTFIVLRGVHFGPRVIYYLHCKHVWPLTAVGLSLTGGNSCDTLLKV